MADSLRINEAALLEMGFDLPTVNALRALQDSQQGSAASLTDFQAVIMSLIPGEAKKNDNYLEAIVALVATIDSQSGKIKSLMREVQLLKQKIDFTYSNKELKQLQRDVEALKATVYS